MELGKNLNADEAATMGAVYRAADLATGFKVKKFIVKDAVLFPIQVTFERETGGKKPVIRTLFGPMNVYPQKKVITFNKHKQDFEFAVNYADLDYLGASEIANIGPQNISKVQLTNVGKLMEEKVQDGVESKGIKAHFALDDSGIFSLVHVELLLEKSADGLEEEEEGTLSKLGSTISKLFSGDKDDNKVESAPANETETESTEAPPAAGNDTEVPTQETPTNETAKNETTTEEKEKEKPKVVVIKERVEASSDLLVLKPLDGDQYTQSKDRIEEFSKIERQKLRRESAVNNLESHVIEAQMRLDQNEYASCATEKEAEEIRSMCSTISDWLYEDGIDADVEVFEEKLDTLRKKTDEVYARHWEHNERPEALKALHSMINGSEHFLASARNITKDPLKGDVFTTKEVDDLEKAIQEVVEWRDKEVAAQDKLAKNEPIRLTVKHLTDKMSYLDREVKYLVNKIKAWRPKEKPKKKKKPTNETVTETAEEVVIEKVDEEVDASAPSDEIPIGEGTVEEPTLEQIDPAPTETTEEAQEEQHTEL
jgi:hypoxia up-regulated 1